MKDATLSAQQQRCCYDISTFGAAAENRDPATVMEILIIRLLFYGQSLKELSAAADRTDGGAEHHGADHPLLSVGGNLELIGNKG